MIIQHKRNIWSQGDNPKFGYMIKKKNSKVIRVSTKCEELDYHEINTSLKHDISYPTFNLSSNKGK